MNSANQLEQARLNALRSYEILDTQAEASFDRLTQLAARICETPIATITFVDEARQWFKSAVGLNFRQTERQIAFCAHAIRGKKLFVVEDAQSTPLFADNPLVAGASGIRFYAGMPLIAPDGFALGTIAVMDRMPRKLTGTQIESLQTLAEQVMVQLELRRLHFDSELQRKDREQKNTALLQVASQAIRLGGWEVALPEERITWSDAVYEMLEVELGTNVTVEQAISFYTPDSQQKIIAAAEACKLLGIPFDEEIELITAKGRRLWARAIGLAVRNSAGTVTHIQGAFQDISESKLKTLALSQSEQRFRQLADAMPYIVWSAEPNGAIDYGNQTVSDYAGLPKIDVDSQNWINILHPDDVEPTLSRWTEAVGTGHTFSCEYRILRVKDNCYRWHLAQAMPIRDEHGTIVKWYGTCIDIHDSKLASDEIERLAFYDQLTHLPNRQLLMDRLSHAVALHSRSSHIGAVIMIDLDNFKTLNDTLGHDKGDVLLSQVATRLASCVRESDTVARLGGDEFVILLEELGESEEEAGAHASSIARKILDRVNITYDLGGYAHHITTSIGITLFGGQNHSIGELLKRADLAMYQAKAEGRNTVCFFDPRIQAMALERATLESELRQGLQMQEFQLHYQPQISSLGCMTGVEALIRWRHPQRGMVSPVQFIALAEDTGLILPLGRWILEQACSQLACWSSHAETASLSIAVNVSARQFRHPDFVANVLSVIQHSGAPPQKLKIELTESLLLDDLEQTIEKMNLLKAQGVSFALDDFGTGYSSLSYLKRLPLDQLKIDPSFIRNVASDPKDAAIVSTIITLGHTMGMKVIAEGVETHYQREFLLEHGCQDYQGYLFSKPLPIEQLNLLILNQNNQSGLLQAGIPGSIPASTGGTNSIPYPYPE